MVQSLTPSPAETATNDRDRPTRAGIITGLTFVGALVFALIVRGPGIVGIAALFLVFVPLEKLFAPRPQKVLRRGLLTDLTHLLVNRFFVTLGAYPFTKNARARTTGQAAST